MQEEKEKLKESLSKKEPELEDLENSNSICIAKYDKTCYGKNTKDVPGNHSMRRLLIILIRYLSRLREQK